MMFFHVQADSPLTIHEQIVAQVTFAVAAGSLHPGDFIPSVRDLANDLVINPTTVAKAFTELEERGVVEARRGRGTVIAAGAVELCQRERLRLVRERIRAALRDAVFSGLPAHEIKKVADEELARAHGGQFREKR
jgi:GntR family transcriptional regulator